LVLTKLKATQRPKPGSWLELYLGLSRRKDRVLLGLKHLKSHLWSCDTEIKIILSIISFINEKVLNSNNNKSKPKFLRLLWDIVVLRLFSHLLNMIRLNLPFLYKVYLYKFSSKFDTVFFYQFLETGTSEKTLMVSIKLLKCLDFSLYPPFIFPFQSL